MDRRDVNLVRTAADLERKYDFSKIGELTKNYELQKLGLNKVENELNEFATQVTKDIKDLQSQVDGKIATWFSNGIPTTENYPTNEWTTEELKIQHTGDIYYNRDTGYAYRYIQQDSSFEWVLIEDIALTQALALANAAKDTADKKRQVFIEEPIPPYDVGDLWIKDRELYRCQTTKASSETFEENDWIIALKYTDDTVANQVGNNLTILSGTVTEIIEDVDELSNKMTNTTQLVNEQGEKIGNVEIKISETTQTVDEISQTVSGISTNLDQNYTANDVLEQRLEEQKNTLANEMTTHFEQTMSSFTFDIIQKLNEDGVTTLKNTMVTIDEKGINTAKNNEDVVSLLNNQGLYVSDGPLKEDEANILMKTDRNGAYFKTIEVKSTIKEHDIIQKEKIEDETFGTCQGWYWIGDEA